MLRKAILFFIALFLGSVLLSSCAMLKGDPRKNCNHPKHGQYMKEQQLKRIRG